LKQIDVKNPFNAPVFFEETVSSTMDISRKLASDGQPHGTVIVADYQEAGRGRIKGRQWNMDRGLNLAFTILLRFPSAKKIPHALTLRIGLAISIAIEDFAPELEGEVKIKWPNDIMIYSKKAAGIYCEAFFNGAGLLDSDCPNPAGGANVHAGIGINVAQKTFSGELQDRATSICLAAGKEIHAEDRFQLLGKIIKRLHNELSTAEEWDQRLGERLYKKDQQVKFISGPADSGEVIVGVLTGTNAAGELLIETNEGIMAFAAGELRV